VEKKNPYITTIGFKKEDPEHVYVAELLNSMGRGKAQYIVKAVMCYQKYLKNGQTGLREACDYELVKQMVYRALQEFNGSENAVLPETPVKQDTQQSKEPEDSMLSGLDEDAMSGILASIAAFQAT